MGSKVCSIEQQNGLMSLFPELIGLSFLFEFLEKHGQAGLMKRIMVIFIAKIPIITKPFPIKMFDVFGVQIFIQ